MTTTQNDESKGFPLTGGGSAPTAGELASIHHEAYTVQEHEKKVHALNHPEDGPQSPAEPLQASPRTFYRSDYGRAARFIQAARHVPGDPYTAKPEAQMDTVSALAVALATAFALDSPDHFGPAEFFNASALPVKSKVQVTDVQLPEDEDTTLADEWTANGEPLPGTPDEDDGGPGDYFEVTPDDWNGTPEESDPTGEDGAAITMRHIRRNVEI